MEEELAEGCIVWTDEAGDSWCMDVRGAYGVPGTVSKLEGGQWVVARGDGWDDGCIYWEDERGVSWCLDLLGSHGPPGAEYWGEDGGVTWFSNGEAWLELGDEARDYFAASESTRQRRKAAAESAPGTKKWENRLKVFDIPGKSGKVRDGEAGGEQQFGKAQEEAERRRMMYGSEGLVEIEAAEAELQARFDEVRFGGGKRILWPEMPLNL